MQNRFRGLVAAPFTPFNADRSINLDAIPGYARFLKENGVGAAFVCGTTGEGLSLTLEERLAVSAKWVESTGATLPVIVHVGHTCLEDARKLSAHAAQIGAAAISALAPMFFKPRTVDELVDWCEAVASAAPALPFYYYNIPSMTGVSFPVADFLARAADRIPSLVGVKYTHEDLPDYRACVAAADGRPEVARYRDQDDRDLQRHRRHPPRRVESADGDARGGLRPRPPAAGAAQRDAAHDTSRKVDRDRLF